MPSYILAEHGVPEDMRDELETRYRRTLMALKEVKQTRVTYLELAEYEEAIGSRDGVQ